MIQSVSACRDLTSAVPEFQARALTQVCVMQTNALQSCMQEHKDYYKDILYEQAGEQSLEAVQDEILEHEHKAIEGKLLRFLHAASLHASRRQDSPAGVHAVLTSRSSTDSQLASFVLTVLTS